MDIVALKPILSMMGIPFTELELDTTVPVTSSLEHSWRLLWKS